MSTPAEPLRLLLLAEEPEWAVALGESLLPLAGTAVLLTAPTWESVDSLFARDRNAVVLTTPGRQPA
ncbi:MAG TPA: GGDEF-domain containing protein, partial [Pseudomonas sp.]|nr:GGDEF-domain containing protein [Pseudomonas sp.]